MIDIVILGDRYQKGKKSKGCPGLIPCNNNKLTTIEYQINNIKKVLPESTINYVSGFDKDKLENFLDKIGLKDTINIINNENYLRYNESYSLSIALNFINQQSDVLVISGYYVPLALNNINFSKSTLFLDNKKTKLGCIINHKNIVENIFFDLDNYIQEMYFLQNKDVKNIRNLLTTNKYNNAFLFELINNIIDSGSIFYTHNLFTKSKNYAKKKNSYI
jgi:hypothetical protein